MLVCAAGDCHGALDAMYDRLLQLEEEVGRQVDLVVQVGDLGVWPDASRLDRATRNRGQGGDFAAWWRDRRRPLRPTVFIAGNHEDFPFLASGGTRELLPDLVFLSWGEVFTFEARGEALRIGGIGGCYGMKDYLSASLPGGSRRHYLQRELLRLAEQREPRIDILMLHDAPAGEIAILGSPGKKRQSQSEGLGELVATVQPRICLTGHLHIRSEREINGVRVAGLNLIPHPGSLLFLDFPPGDQPPANVAEWGRLPVGGDPQKMTFAGSPPVVDQVPLHDLVACVYRWAEEVLGEGGPGDGPADRSRRKQVHDLLAHHPYRSLLMNALKNPRPSSSLENSSVWRMVEDRIPPGQRAEVLAHWQAGGLPDAQTLRALAQGGEKG